MKTNIVLYNTEKAKPRFETEAAIRSWGILLAISKGSFRLSFPDTGESHTVAPYEISYVPPNTPFCRVILEPIDFHQFAFEILDTPFSLEMLPAGKLPIPHDQVKAILESADRLSQSHIDSAWMREHILHRMLTDGYLFSHHSPSRVSRELLSVTEYIKSHLDEPLSVSSLAENLHLSHNGLIWKFKHELHTTPLQYISSCRLARAKQLLLESDMTMVQIAEACGYANAYYFSGAFKKAEGIAPTAYRRQYQ
jgi:AraC-like DNA-binding protein